MVVVKCPACGRVEKLPDSYRGMVLECECGEEVPVPERGGSPVPERG